MLIMEGIKNVTPGAKNLEEAVGIYYRFYSKEEEILYGVVGLNYSITK